MKQHIKILRDPGIIDWNINDEIPVFDSIPCYFCNLEDEIESKATILFMVEASVNHCIQIQGSCHKHGIGSVNKFNKTTKEKHVATSQKEMEVILNEYTMEYLMRL